MADINIFPLGGQDENGKNCFVLEVNNDIYVINAGIKVPVNNKHGVDGIIPDFQYLIDKKDRIKGIFVTHAHDDMFAAMPWLLMDLKGVKVFASEFTAEIIKDRVSKYKIGHDKFSIEIIKGNIDFGSVKLKSFELANSIVGSLALNFQTPDGDVIVMSSHTNANLGPFGNTDLEAIRGGSNKVLALLLDAKRSNYHGTSESKVSVTPLIEDKFKNAGDDKRIIVGGYDEEMYTLENVMNLAIKYNRPVAIYGRTFDFLYKTLAEKNPSIKLPKIIDFRNINKHDNVVVLVTGTWSRIFKRFVRVAHKNDVFLKLKTNDVIIMIAPPVNGLEVEASQALDEVAKIAYDITDISDKDFYPTRPTGEDIAKIVSTLKPTYFLPISGLYRYLIVATNIAVLNGVTRDRNIVLQNGKIAYIKDGKLASQKQRIKKYGDIIIDGFGVGDISREVIRERQQLGAGGLVTIVAQISRKTKMPVGEIHVQLVGLATKSELPELQENVKNVVIQKLEDQVKWDHREVQNNIRKRVRKVMSKFTNKEPLVVTTFFEV